MVHGEDIGKDIDDIAAAMTLLLCNFSAPLMDGLILDSIVIICYYRVLLRSLTQAMVIQRLLRNFAIECAAEKLLVRDVYKSFIQSVPLLCVQN